MEGGGSEGRQSGAGDLQGTSPGERESRGGRKGLKEGRVIDITEQLGLEGTSRDHLIHASSFLLS